MSMYRNNSPIIYHYLKGSKTISEKQTSGTSQGYQVANIPMILRDATASREPTNNIISSIGVAPGSRVGRLKAEFLCKPEGDDIQKMWFGKVYGAFERIDGMIGEFVGLSKDTATGKTGNAKFEDSSLSNGILDIETDPEKKKWYGKRRQHIFYAKAPKIIRTFYIPRTVRRMNDFTFLSAWFINMDDEKDVVIDYTIKFEEYPLLDVKD